MQLRPYQREAIDAAWGYLRAESGNPCLVLPVGAGKTIVMAELIREALTAWPGTRIAVIAHVRELVSQNADKLSKHWLEAPIGIYSASLKRRDRFEPVIFASIQSVYDKAMQLGRFDLLLIDEAHRIPLRSEGMYRDFIDGCRRANPALRIVGLTATPYRLGAGMVCGPEYILNDVAYEARIGDLIRCGYLSRLVSKGGLARADLSTVHVRNGEYIASELQDACNVARVVEAACDEIVALCADRHAWVVFCAGVAHAERVSDALRRRGIACAVVEGEMSATRRDEAIADFQAGRLRALCNVNVLCEGFDAPRVDAIVMLRPTKSAGLYVQQVGRGTRLCDGKPNCIAEGQLVLTDHGLVPIERVSTAMKVWDGIEFVSHCGTIFRGQREVIEYAGLIATEDHQVWTQEGWKAFGECAVQQAAICVTGSGREAIRQAAGRYRRGGEKDSGRQASFADRVHNLRCSLVEGLHQLAETAGRLSQLWQPARCTEMAGDACDFSEAALHQSERQCLRSLWRPRNSVSIRIANGNGRVGPKQSRSAQGLRIGSDQQRRPLRAGKPALSHSVTESVEHPKASGEFEAAPIPATAPVDSLRRCDPAQDDRHGSVVRGDRDAIRAGVRKAERRVWDILNCGPRNRFTVEGLLVHNCLVLDFAGNIAEHGPVDSITVRRPRAGGKAEVTGAPTKQCPQCQAIVIVQVRECPECGHRWPLSDAARHDESATTAAILGDQVEAVVLTVNRVSYARHDKLGGIPSLRVTYTCGLRTFREWVCIEHAGMARAKAVTWWTRRAGDPSTPVPRTVDEALLHLSLHRIAEPSRIRVIERGKYPEIVSHEFDQPDTRAEGGHGGDALPRPGHREGTAGRPELPWL